MTHVSLTDPMGNELRLNYAQHQQGGWAINLTQDGMPYAMLTCNVPEASLEPLEVVVKTYSENALFVDHVLPQLVEQGVLAPTYKTVAFNHVECPIYRIETNPVHAA